jgi:thiamine biosynthesis lipoprotein
MPSSKSKNKPKAERTFRFAGIGTQWQVIIYDDIADARLRAIQQAFSERIDGFDRTYSRFRPDSQVSRIAKKAGRYELPDDAEALFDMYEKLYAATDGAVTPLIGQTLADAGYDATYSLQPQPSIAAVPAWEDVIEYVDGELITKQPVLLDFGAAGKGYLVDILAAVIAGFGIERYCIDASGDIFYKNKQQPLQVGLEDPADPTQAIGIAQLRQGSICASATNRRRWGSFNHVMEPHTRRSVEHIRATWVMADTALLADGLATALFFTEPLKLRQEFEFEYVRVDNTGQAEISNGFSGQLFGA